MTLEVGSAADDGPWVGSARRRQRWPAPGITWIVSIECPPVSGPLAAPVESFNDRPTLPSTFGAALKRPSSKIRLPHQCLRGRKNAVPSSIFRGDARGLAPSLTLYDGGAPFQLTGVESSCGVSNRVKNFPENEEGRGEGDLSPLHRAGLRWRHATASGLNCSLWRGAFLGPAGSYTPLAAQDRQGTIARLQVKRLLG